MDSQQSERLFDKAQTLFPGGVNSPVRAFKAVKDDPIFIAKGEGCMITDVDGNKYIDFCCSWGPLILGHNHPAVHQGASAAMRKGLSFGAPTKEENDLAELILSNHSKIEMLRFVNSGTEATMSAIRLARGVSGRDKIIKFDGCYHGHADHLLVKAGSGLATLGCSSSAGVPTSFANETIVLPLNDREAVKAAFAAFKDEIACIIIEPLPANNGLLVQEPEYLHFLRDITKENGSLLIFDEVISGFRIGFEGAAAHYGMQPDIITFGKIIGGGMPVGAYGGSREIMMHIAPEGGVYQAGTLSGNPVAMAAGLAQLRECLKPGFYEKLEEKTNAFTQQINLFAKERNYSYQMIHFGSVFWGTFNGKFPIRSASDISPVGVELFGKLHSELLKRGVYLGPSAYEVGFVSAAHGTAELSTAAAAFCEGLDAVLG